MVSACGPATRKPRTCDPDNWWNAKRSRRSAAACGGRAVSGKKPRQADAPALHLRLSQPGPIEPAAGARGWPQSRGDVADRTARAGSQNHRRLPQGQWFRDQEGLRTICRVVPEDGPAGEGQRVAIDGSKFKAVNSRDNNFTQGKIQRRQKRIEESVARYMSQLDTADRQTAAGEEPSETVLLTKTRLQEKLAKLEEEVKRLAAIEKALLASPDKQISLTDPDCRSMATSGRGSGMVAYNVQSAVDTTNHLIVAHEVTNIGTDRSQLATMAQAAKAALRSDNLDVVADRGYFKGEEILACEQAGVAVTLPKPQTSGAKSAGRFGKPDFVYLAKDDVYRCPAGEKLAHHFTADEDGQKMRIYLTKACRTCPFKDQCTTSNERRIKRWEHEHVVEAAETRLDQNPQAMRVRRETVEHPFATLKMRMGATHFLMKRLPNVATEMALNVLSYNLTRVLNIVGVKPLLAAMRV